MIEAERGERPVGIPHRFNEDTRRSVDAYLREYLGRDPDGLVAGVASYALLHGGHRWRALTCVAAGLIFDDRASEICLSAAAAVEMAHAASMILDDLPSMDDARLRRGRACAHRVYPRWAVDLTPVFLVSAAHELFLDNRLVAEARRVAATLEVTRAAFHMIKGQAGDLTAARGGCDEGQLLECYEQKTGALYAASMKAGAILCGASREDAERLGACGMDMGIAYQLLDDVADVDGDVDDLGKEPGMDVTKTTMVDLLGLEGTRRLVSRHQRRAMSHLESFGLVPDHPLPLLVREASVRTRER